MFNFDGTTRVISLDLGTVAFGATDLYSEWKRWVQTADNAKFWPAFNTLGGESITPDNSQRISPYYFLINGWRVRPQEANHQLTITGNLVTDDGSPVTTNTLGGFEVTVQAVVSGNSLTVSAGSGLSTDQAAQLVALYELAGLDPDKPLFVPPGAGTITVDGDAVIDVTGDCETGHTLTGRA